MTSEATPQRIVRLISYNIESGGQNADGSNRLPLVAKIIRRRTPDSRIQHVVGLQETNNFEDNNNTLLRQISHDTGYLYSALSPAGEQGKKYSVTTLSSLPFIARPERIRGFRNAAIVTKINLGGKIGQVTMANIHLSPYNEASRVGEIQRTIHALANDKNRIIIGDFNALSSRDRYSSSTVRKMNDTQLKKFTDGRGYLQYSAIQSLLDAGYVDVAELFRQQSMTTVPTRRRSDKAHQLPLRLDYVFVSPSLVPFIKSYKVLKTLSTERASDHYPVVIEITP